MVARFPSSLICWPPSVCLPLSVSLAVFFKSVFLFPLQLRQRVHLVFRCNIIQKNAKHFQDIFLSSRFSVWVSVSVFLSVCLFIDGLFFLLSFYFQMRRRMFVLPLDVCGSLSGTNVKPFWDESISLVCLGLLFYLFVYLWSISDYFMRAFVALVYVRPAFRCVWLYSEPEYEAFLG